MTKYRVYGVVSGSKYLGEFDAETEEQALEMASHSDECYVTLCHYCHSECEDAEITEMVAEK